MALRQWRHVGAAFISSSRQPVSAFGQREEAFDGGPGWQRYDNPSGSSLRDPKALVHLVVDVQGVFFGTA